MKKSLIILIVTFLCTLSGICEARSLIIPTNIAEQIIQLGYQPSDQGFFKSAADGNIRALSLFADANIFINIKDSSGRTPVYMASSTGKTKAVKFLLLYGADINARTENMKSPLMAAIQAKSYETAKLLIDSNASLKVCDDNGHTPLHYAVINNQLGITQYIISMYCDVDAIDNDGNTPLFYTADKSIAYMQALINGGADKNGKNSGGKTLLHQCVIKNNIEGVKFLIENGVNVNIQDNSGNTPIKYAQANGIIYNFLIESGAKAPN